MLQGTKILSSCSLLGIILCMAGFKLATKFREECLSPRKFGRSFYLKFLFAYILYTFSPLSGVSAENKEKFFHLGRLFLPSRPVGYSLHGSGTNIEFVSKFWLRATENLS